MESIIIDGKKISKEIIENLKQKVAMLSAKKKLAIIYVGDNFASSTYIKMKKEKAEYIGIQCDVFHYQNDVSQNSLEENIKSIVNNNDYSGIMIQHPLPKHIDEQACFNLIPPQKDVDGLSATSFGLMAQGKQKFIPATALGIIKLFEYYNINLTSKNVLIIGKSQIVGLPLSVMMMKMGATVTVAHSKTKNIFDIIKNFDIVIVAIGKPEFFKAECFAENQIIIDAGFNDGCVGDIDKNTYKKVAYYTPVPGGVGPMTIASLLFQTVQSME